MGFRQAESGLRQVVVGDDEVESEGFSGFRSGKGANAGVHTDDEADAFASGDLKYFTLHSVAFAQAMRDVESDNSTESLDGGFEEDDGCGSVDVVVTIDKDGLAGADGSLDALDSGGHPEHEVGIVQMIESGREKARCFGGAVNAAGDEQARDERRQTRFAWEEFFSSGIRLVNDPALWRAWMEGSVERSYFRRAHRG